MKSDEDIDLEVIKLKAFKIHIPFFAEGMDSNWDAIAAQERVLKERLAWSVVDTTWPNALKTMWCRQAAAEACDWMNDGISVSPTLWWRDYEKHVK